MKDSPASSTYLPSRASVLFGRTRALIAATSLCRRKFATRVVEIYMQRVEPEQRRVPFRWGVTGDDLYKAERHNDQIIGRYLDGTVQLLPHELEDAWVLALPDPYRAEAERELAARRGQLAVPLPSAAVNAPLASVACMTREFGELLAAIAPALQDGVINEQDRPLLRRVRGEGNDLIACVMSVCLHADALLDQPAKGQGSAP